jgi:hypothetical protein
MNSHDFWGLVSSVFFLSAIPAIGHQIRTIAKRRKLRALGELNEPATHSVSVNQVFSSFFAVYTFFIFGLVVDSKGADPFLTYPRAIVGLLLYWIIWEIYRERRTSGSRAAFYIASGSILLSVLVIASGFRGVTASYWVANGLVSLATVMMAQGAYSQYRTLKLNRSRGAVSLPMHVVLYLKDLTGMIYGFQIGYLTAWSIIVMHLVNVVFRTPIIVSYLNLRNRAPSDNYTPKKNESSAESDGAR